MPCFCEDRRHDGRNGGFSLNDELEKFYTDYNTERITGSLSENTDWTLPEPSADSYTSSMIDDAKNFSDTAGALQNLDLVICNDTSLAHLAGAMNIPCWILLPYNYNWRWHLDLSKCDWYESVKLYRQKQAGDWDEIFDRMYNDLVLLREIEQKV